MSEISRMVHAALPHPLDEQVWNLILCEQDTVTQQLLLDDMLMCKDCPPSVEHVDVWNTAVQYVFDNNVVDISNSYVVDARDLRREYMRDDRARIRVLLGRGARGR